MKNRTFIAIVIAIALAGINVPVRADGFKIHELTPIKQEFWSIFDASAYHAEEPTNFRMSCCGTDDDQHLMIAIDRHVDEQGHVNRTDEGYLKELDVSSEIVGFKVEKNRCLPCSWTTYPHSECRWPEGGEYFCRGGRRQAHNPVGRADRGDR